VRVALVAALLALTLVPAAQAGEILDRAAAALQDDPVYVDPQADPTLTEAEKQRVEDAISGRGEGPIYIAVLPADARKEAGGDATEALRQLVDGVHRRGVYAIVAGGQLRAGATGNSGLDKDEAPRLATEAFDAQHQNGLAPTLVDFVDRVGAAREADGDGNGFRWWPIALVGVVVFLTYRVLRRRRAQSDDLDEVKEAAREDLVALADDVAGLEDDVERDPAAKRDYLEALDQYGRASRAFDRARTPRQLEPVARALDEGRYLMTSAKARLDGHDPPERRPACFFDPRHGPSVRDVEWFADGGTAREVPACAACAIRVDEGVEPESRHVLAGGRSVPYWSAPGPFGSYFGGFLPGLLVGDAIGGGFGGWDAPGDGADANGDLGDFGGGDFGGDFGGGDGGGGDF
jgi:hypothetical protein